MLTTMRPYFATMQPFRTLCCIAGLLFVVAPRLCAADQRTNLHHRRGCKLSSKDEGQRDVSLPVLDRKHHAAGSSWLLSIARGGASNVETAREADSSDAQWMEPQNEDTIDSDIFVWKLPISTTQPSRLSLALMPEDALVVVTPPDAGDVLSLNVSDPSLSICRKGVSLNATARMEAAADFLQSLNEWDLYSVQEEGGDDTLLEESRHAASLTDHQEPEEDEIKWDDMSHEEILNLTGKLRSEGKEQHNTGAYKLAAVTFSKAAKGLETLPGRKEDACACQLHEALCWLKAQEYETAVDVCNKVLAHDSSSVSPALRARALYRRAKARLALGEDEAATRDARSAAFLGDRKAVELYGQLLRDESGGGATPAMSSMLSSSPTDDSKDLLSALLGNSAAGSGMESLFGAANPDRPADGQTNNPFASMPPQSPFGGLPGMGSLFGLGNKKGKQSIMKSLSSKQTQEMICSVLQSTNSGQIRQYAGMAGFDMSENQASRLAGFCQAIKPKHLRTCVNTSRRLWYCVRLMQKTGALIAKYRTPLVFLFLLFWARTLFQ